MIVLDACVGKGAGSKILTEAEGDVFEILIAAEQGAYQIETFADLKNYFWPDIDDQSIKLNDEDVLTPDMLLDTLKSIQNKKIAAFREGFFEKMQKLKYGDILKIISSTFHYKRY